MESPQPVVKLTNFFMDVYNNAVATARTCYSSKGIVTAEQTAAKPVLRDRISASIFKAGHHTVIQHAHFQFALSGISRQFVWDFLHQHPFYNSEQQSQRYCKVHPGHYYVPDLSPEASSEYHKIVGSQLEAYIYLGGILEEEARDEYFKIFPARRKHADKYSSVVQKKAQEISRYVLPIATHTALYHTISLVTLLRYQRVAQDYPEYSEARAVVSLMVDSVVALCPELSRYFKDDIGVFSPGPASGKIPCPARLTQSNYEHSLMLDSPSSPRALLEYALSMVQGSGGSAESVLNPAKNPLLGESLNVAVMDKKTRVLDTLTYTFEHCVSHAADSQDQRHRMVPGARPKLHLLPFEDMDYYVPRLVAQSELATSFYRHYMTTLRQQIRDFMSRFPETPRSEVVHLLPNAFNVRYIETGSLLHLWHKYKMRLCYNAQEEIWASSLEEVKQITAHCPEIGQYLLPPCGIRKLAGLKPFCPEGDRFCGVRVWDLDVEAYQRVI